MSENDKCLSVTIQVRGNEIAPSLEKIVDSMTDDDKRKLAAGLAKEYFLKQMNPGRDHYGHRKDANAYMEDLCRKFERSIQDTIKEDPKLLKIIKDTIDALRPDFPQFIQSAVIHVLGSLVKNGFQEVFDTQLQIEDIRTRLADRLEQLTGGGQ